MRVSERTASSMEETVVAEFAGPVPGRAGRAGPPAVICRAGRAPRRVLGRGPNGVDDSAAALRRRDRAMNCSFSLGDARAKASAPRAARAEAFQSTADR